MIAIDDGSTDSSATLLRASARNDERVRVVSGSGGGIVSALGIGLEYCAGALIARMDADDVMHPARLQCQFDAMVRWPQCAVVGSRVSLFPSSRITDGMREYIDWQNGCVAPDELRDNIYVEAPFTHPSVLMRRDALNAVGGYIEGPFPEDYELWLRLVHAGFELRKLRSVLTAWRLGATSLSRRDGRYSRDAFDKVRAQYLACDARLTNERAVVVWGAGRRTRLRFAHLRDLGCEIVAWVDIDPRKLGNRVWGAPVLPPVWLRYQQPKPFVLNYVASHGARVTVERYLDNVGYERGKDYLSVG